MAEAAWLELYDCRGGAIWQELESKEKATRGARVSPQGRQTDTGRNTLASLLLHHFSLPPVPLIGQASWQRSLGNVVPCNGEQKWGTVRAGNGSENRQMTKPDIISPMLASVEGKPGPL